jgi:hypothetical protein
VEGRVKKLSLYDICLLSWTKSYIRHLGKMDR